MAIRAGLVPVPILAKLISDVVSDRANNRHLSRGIQACRTRRGDFKSPLEMQLAGIAMAPEARDMATRVLNRHWASRALNTGRFTYYGDREVVIGAGFQAAVYCASRVLAGHAPPIVLEQGDAEHVGGAMAVSPNAVFRLNSRNRPGPGGLPDQNKGLNFIPGGLLQPAMVSSEEYVDNALMAWLIRLTLAQYAEVYPNMKVNKLDLLSGSSEPVVCTDGGNIIARRIIDARGCGATPAGKADNQTIFTFEQFMARMGGMFPLQGMNQVAIIGGGNSGLCAAESVLGIAPGNTSVTGLDYVQRADLYATTIDGGTCSEFREAQRGRYIRLAQSLDGNVSNPTSRLRVMGDRGNATAIPGGVLVNERTYDMAVMCTGLKRPYLDQLNYVQVGSPALATKAIPHEIYRIGPAADLPFSTTEVAAGITDPPANSVSMFRLAPRTAALAGFLSLGGAMPGVNYRRTTFQMRPVNGRGWAIYIFRVGGTDIPRDQQPLVYGPDTVARTQVICDALNRGLLTRVITHLSRLLAR